MEKQAHYFGFRFENALEKRLIRYCGIRNSSLSRFAARAFRFTAAQHNRRKILFTTASGFKSRTRKEDKTETVLIQTGAQREMVRNFAFVYRISMAEVLRIALEVYLDHLETAGGKLDAIKHVYRLQQDIKVMTLIILYPAFPAKPPLDFHFFDH